MQSVLFGKEEKPDASADLPILLNATAAQTAVFRSSIQPVQMHTMQYEEVYVLCHLVADFTRQPERYEWLSKIICVCQGQTVN